MLLERKIHNHTCSRILKLFCSMCSIVGKPLTWLIGDTFGRICLLALHPSDPILTLVVLGEVSKGHIGSEHIIDRPHT